MQPPLSKKQKQNTENSVVSRRIIPQSPLSQCGSHSDNEEDPVDNDDRVSLYAGCEASSLDKQLKAFISPVNNTGLKGIDDESSSSKDILQQLTCDLDNKEKCSPKVSKELADIFHKIWKTQLSAEKAKLRLDKYLRPHNIELLGVKRVNEEIWSLNKGQMGSIRSTDSKLQSTQLSYTKAIIPVLRLADEFLKYRHDPTHQINPDTGLELCINSIVLSCLGRTQMDQIRRDAFKQALPSEMRALASATKDSSDSALLFGEDLEKTVQSLTTKSKLKSSLTDTRSSYKQSYAYNKHGQTSSSNNNNYRKNLNRFPTKKYNRKSTSGKQQYKKWDEDKRNNNQRY